MEFYILNKELGKEAIFAESEHFDDYFNLGEPERCPACNGAVSMLELLPPINVKLTSKFLADFIYGEITPFIVSKNFMDSFVKSGLKGIKEFKAVDILKINGVKEKVNLKYFLPKIIRSEARIDEVASKFERSGEIKCDECKKGTIIESYESLNIRPHTWSGEDIFYARWLSGTVFASKRFVEFIEEYKFSNCHHVSATIYSSQF